ncbi:MAG: hypothetical protein NTV34_08505, partial [Proteobacteria bacterium]|nr:hypothetical protein [Pseudomonadota bacterium]
PGYAEYVAKVPPFFPKLLFWQSVALLCFLGWPAKMIFAAPVTISQPAIELPFSMIKFRVTDKKTNKEISWGEETLKYQNKVLTKSTEYFPPGTERKIIQIETSVVDLDDLKVSDYLMGNKLSGEQAILKMTDGKSAVVTYQETPDKKATESRYQWSEKTIIGKTLHHYIVRHWNDIVSKKPTDFDLFVPMKQKEFGFRTKLLRTYDKAGTFYHVISLEPQNWAIRAFVPQMDFHYAVINGLPRLDHYEGATTITIDGDDKRIVTIDFTYVNL